MRGLRGAGGNGQGHEDVGGGFEAGDGAFQKDLRQCEEREGGGCRSGAGARDVPSKPFKAAGHPGSKTTTAAVVLVTFCCKEKHRVTARLLKVNGVRLPDSVK